MKTDDSATQDKTRTGCTAPHPVVPFLFFVATLAVVVAAVVVLL